MHGNGDSGSYQLYRFRSTSRSHCEMIAYANEHDVYVVKMRQQRHVREQVRIASVINRWTAANRNNKSSRCTAMTQSGSIVSGDTRAMMRANERHFDFAVQQRQFAAKMTNRVR